MAGAPRGCRERRRWTWPGLAHYATSVVAGELAGAVALVTGGAGAVALFASPDAAFVTTEVLQIRGGSQPAPA